MSFFLGGGNVSVGRAGIDPLTVQYIHLSLWSHRPLSNVSMSVCMSLLICFHNYRYTRVFLSLKILCLGGASLA